MKTKLFHSTALRKREGISYLKIKERIFQKPKHFLGIAFLIFIYNALPAQTWTQTGSVNSCAGAVSVCKLSNGKVLICGGSEAPTASEIYDPATEEWTATGDLNYGRIYHCLTLLPSGKVLATGGNETIPCEIFDPSTGEWTVAADLDYPRVGHSAVLLNNGKVLIAGGFFWKNDNGYYSFEVPLECLLYDPLTDEFSQTESLTYGHYLGGNGPAVKLISGKVLVAGGENDEVEIYDPQTESWNTAADLDFSAGLNVVGLTSLPSGDVLATAGNLSKRYNALADTWSTAIYMHDWHSDNNMVVLNNGNVLIAGGFTDVVEIYNVSADTWSQVSSLNLPVGNHAVVVLNSGRVLKISGDELSGSDEYTSSKLCYLFGSECTDPSVPVIAATSDSICSGGSTTLSVSSGNLNSASEWKWYSGACGNNYLGGGNSIEVTPSASATYYVRGEGGCITAGSCGQFNVTVTAKPSGTVDAQYENGNTLLNKTVYLGADGLECADLTATDISTGATVSWYQGSTLLSDSENPLNVCPEVSTVYTLKISQNNCITLITDTIIVEDVRCGNGNTKVKICHEGKTICVDENALDSHLGHGDKLGACSLSGNQSIPELPVDEDHEDSDHNGRIFIYPNPMGDVLNIELQNEQDEYAEIDIHTPDGRLYRKLHSGLVPGGEASCLNFNIAYLPSGCYHLSVSFNGKRQIFGIVKL